jgi:hypothetical protein
MPDLYFGNSDTTVGDSRLLKVDGQDAYRSGGVGVILNIDQCV